MRKFEDIMGMHNYEIFCDLVTHTSQKQLVCYIGAGLSLYSKRWGEPFEMIVNELIARARDVGNPSEEKSRLQENLPKLYLLRDSLDILRANQSQEKKAEALKKLKKAYSNVSDDEMLEHDNLDTYPVIGDRIAKILDECNLHIVRQNLPTEPHDTFNDWFCREITKICKEKTAHSNGTDLDLSGRPYSFPSIYYLPYLKKCLRFITTNCDPSLHNIGSILNEFDDERNNNWIARHMVGERTDWANNVTAPSVFYIHGYYTDPSSLIMTDSAYRRAYMDSGKAIPFLQREAIANYALLFLGASLEKDKTVDAINSQLSIMDGETCCVVIGKLDSIKKSNLSKKSPLYIDDFREISVILHQLIRETCVRDNESYSWKQNLAADLQDQDEDAVHHELEESLDSFLNSDEEIDVKEYEESQRSIILRILYENYLHKNGKWEAGDSKGGPFWTLCQIKDRRFNLDLPGPMHNYPLGNTIYILGGMANDDDGNPAIDNGNVTKIINELREWREKTYPGYPDAELFPEKLKIRVICFPSALSVKEIDKKYEELVERYNKLEEELEEAKKQQREQLSSTQEVKAQIGMLQNQLYEVYDKLHRYDKERADYFYSLIREMPQRPLQFCVLIRYLLGLVLSLFEREAQYNAAEQNVNEETFEQPKRLTRGPTI